MKTVLKGELLILVPENGDETNAIADWKAGRDGHVLALLANAGAGLTIRFLGHRADVCREPINVTSRHPDPEVRLIGNFADTPFELDGKRYASVESFWQGLKFPEGSERRRLAETPGGLAKRTAERQEYGPTVKYGGTEVPVGTWAHWQLMERACRAKFDQNPEALSALVATGERPLVHKIRRDSKTIPGIIMADIWMRIRKAVKPPGESAPEDEEE